MRTARRSWRGGIGTLTIESTGKLAIITGGATLDGTFVTDTNASNGIDMSGAALTLNDDTVISGGTMTVESTAGSQLVVTAGRHRKFR